MCGQVVVEKGGLCFRYFFFFVVFGKFGYKRAPPKDFRFCETGTRKAYERVRTTLFSNAMDCFFLYGNSKGGNGENCDHDCIAANVQSATTLQRCRLYGFSLFKTFVLFPSFRTGSSGSDGKRKILYGYY